MEYPLDLKAGAEDVAINSQFQNSLTQRDPVISIQQLTKQYRLGDVEVHALKGVDLKINHSEIVAIMGPSGSGKSTLMNILGCLDVPTSGVYQLEGRDVQHLSRDDLSILRGQKLGFVFQSFNLLPRTHALDNVELPLLYRRNFSAARCREKAMAALKTVGLENRALHFPNQLSGGQQQRVAIARALVNDPIVILADEPTGNLDTQTSHEIMHVFQQLNAKGITIILVTHEPDVARFTSRQIVVRDGRIVSDVNH